MLVQDMENTMKAPLSSMQGTQTEAEHWITEREKGSILQPDVLVGGDLGHARGGEGEEKREEENNGWHDSILADNWS